MPMSPSMPKLSAVPCLIKAKPLRAPLNRAGLDKAPTQRRSTRAWPGRGKAIFNRTGKYRRDCLMP